MTASNTDGVCQSGKGRGPGSGLGRRGPCGSGVAPARLVAFLSVVALLGWTAQAGAITLNPDVDRIDERDSSHEPFDISYQDCIDDDTLTFTISDLQAGDSLSVWVTESADCSSLQTRNDGLCTRVVDQFQLSDLSIELTVSASAIANSLDNVEGCVDSGAVDAARPVKLYFLINESEDPVTVFALWEQTDVNLLGPPPPTDVSVSPADDTELTVSYTADQSTTDFEGFYFYCEATTASGAGGATAGTAFGSGGTSATPASVAAAGFGGGTGGAGQAGAGVGGSALGGTGGSAGVAGSGATAGTGGTSGIGGTTGSGGGQSGDCTAPTLRPGEPPPEGLEPCGETTSETSGIASGLEQGSTYAVAVAGYDLVGNVGKLSALACGTPEPVDDFFEVYRKAGGEAGGGFCGHCGLLGAERPGNWALVCLTGLVLGLAWRRRGRRDGRPC